MSAIAAVVQRSSRPRERRWECPYCAARFNSYSTCEDHIQVCVDVELPIEVEDEEDPVDGLVDLFEKHPQRTHIINCLETIERRDDYPRCRTETPADVLCGLWLQCYLGDPEPPERLTHLPSADDIEQLTRWASGQDPLPERRPA